MSKDGNDKSSAYNNYAAEKHRLQYAYISSNVVYSL